MQLELKDHIDDAIRTDGKDDCADKILKLDREGELEGMTKADIADVVGWSRSHVSNVINDYFVEESHGLENGMDASDTADYRSGFKDGFRTARELMGD